MGGGLECTLPSSACSPTSTTTSFFRSPTALAVVAWRPVARQAGPAANNWTAALERLQSCASPSIGSCGMRRTRELAIVYLSDVDGADEAVSET